MTSPDLIDFPLGTTLLAHVLYGLPRLWSAVTGPVVTLHNGDDFSARDEAPRLDRLRKPRLVSMDGALPVDVRASDEGGIVAHLEEWQGPGWFVVETEPAFIELDADEFEAYLEHEGLASIREARRAAGARTHPGREIYSKYAKVALDSGRGFVPGEIGLPIEIVPIGSGACLAGNELDVRVVRRGQGVEGMLLQATHRASVDAVPRVAASRTTLADGVAAIPIDQPGFWRLHTIAMEPHADRAAADWRSYWASLTFHV